MLTKPTRTDKDIPEIRVLSEDEYRAMKETLARKNFDMSLEEFTEAWKAGKFGGNRKRHGDVIRLAMMLPEYWTD